MERKTERGNFQDKIKDCMQNEPSFCTAACPFHLDVHEFIPKMQRGGFNSAYRTYLNSVGFPVIVSELCNEPCKSVCPRKITDDSVNMKLLEKSCINYARNLDPNSYNIPKKNKRVAIIGAGISGLGCALRLSSKKYDVTVFEKSGRIGGSLWNLMDPELFLEDIKRQFMHEEYNLCLNTEITDLDSLDFDAVYVATGKNGNNFGLERNYDGAYASSRKGVFLGGELCGKNTIEALADGLDATRAIERYIKTGNMNEEELSKETKIKIDTDLIAPAEQAIVPDNGIYAKEDAIEEAKRCMLCSCDACIRNCDLMKYYQKFPKRIGEEVHITIHPGTLDGNGTVATRLISTCNHCGLCKEVCPVDIDTGEFLLQSHYAMRKKGAMPWVFHDFWLKDMEFTNGEKAFLCKIPEGYNQSKYVYFPGCQLGASDPAYVVESYRYLLKHNKDTALLLHCCGAPADWAGDEAVHDRTIESIRNSWIEIGKPTLIFSCATCKQMFDKYMPEIKGVFIYELMSDWGINIKKRTDETVSVFDPCTSRHEANLQHSVRILAKHAHLTLNPLPYEGKYARCCSWGGQPSIANPSYARDVVKSRIAEGDSTYVAYCANCRDIFAQAGKTAYHIFDILFDLNDSVRPAPTFTQRRKNRIMLKKQLLNEFWNYDVNMEPENNKIRLYISSGLKQKINSEMILEEDIEAVIDHCENTGRKILDPESGHFIGHMKVDNMTFWVEYAPRDDGFELFKAYGHRMSIVEE